MRDAMKSEIVSTGIIPANASESRIESTMRLLDNALVCYAGNAVLGRGGQGEFLRQMTYALDRLAQGRVLSRGAQAPKADCIDVPFEGWTGFCGRAIERTPLLRRRHDLLTLINDVDFDSRVAGHVDDVKLFDGVMAQCCHTFERLSRKRTPLILTSLNSHVDHLTDALESEHRRLQIRAGTFIHPSMVRRARREIELASCIRVVSDLSKRSFMERRVKPENIEVILPAVDLNYFRPVEKKDNSFRVLAVITIDARKGALYLLEAFEKAAIPGSELVIIGATGDPWSKQMLQRFRTRMPNLRIQSADVFREPIDATYGQASVLVHPAIEDGFGLAVAQALACGKPVITTHQTGAAQLVKDGQNGYVLPCRDVDGMVERLRLLAHNESLLGRLTAAAPSAVAHLGYSAFSENVARFYNRVLANQ